LLDVAIKSVVVKRGALLLVVLLLELALRTMFLGQNLVLDHSILEVFELALTGIVLLSLKTVSTVRLDCSSVRVVLDMPRDNVVLDRDFHFAVFLHALSDATAVDFALLLAEELLLDLNNIVIITGHGCELLVNEGVDARAVLVVLFHLNHLSI
jgi:hypothetical protein